MVRAGYYRSGAPGSNPVQISTLLFFFLSKSVKNYDYRKYGGNKILR